MVLNFRKNNFCGMNNEEVHFLNFWIIISFQAKGDLGWKWFGGHKKAYSGVWYDWSGTDERNVSRFVRSDLANDDLKSSHS